jgi:CRP/FNR family transcriptional regulator
MSNEESEGQSKVWYLKKVNIFAGLSEDEMERVDRSTRMESVPKGSYLFLPEDPADRLYFIKKGRVKISKISDDGKEVTLAILEEGEVFGEMALVEEGPRKTVAEAVEDTAICTMSKENFETLIQQKPELSIKITKLMGIRRMEIESRVEELLFCDVSTRLARFLTRLNDEHGVDHRLGRKIKVKITHQDIANLIGSTRETTTAALNDLKRAGVIDFEHRHIIIKDNAALAEAGGLDP